MQPARPFPVAAAGHAAGLLPTKSPRNAPRMQEKQLVFVEKEMYFLPLLCPEVPEKQEQGKPETTHLTTDAHPRLCKAWGSEVLFRVEIK